MHSGRQFGGLPKNSSIQAHEGELFTSLHIAFGPHGEGKQGLTYVSGSTSVTIGNLLISLMNKPNEYIAKTNYIITFYFTATERVTFKPLWTGANRIMIYDLTLSTSTTISFARINATLI